jgi:uncharacterized protein
LIYVFTLLDKPDHIDLRVKVRPAHLEYLKPMADKVAFAGPLTKDDGVSMIGTLWAIDFPSRDAAHAFLANEPFNKAGLFASTSIHAFVNRSVQKAGFPETH